MKAAEMHTANMKSTEMKETQSNKSDKKEVEIPAREAKRTTGSFKIENEINKIKILVPLVELEKNPTYRKQIAKMINFSDIES